MLDQIEKKCWTYEAIKRELVSCPTRMLVALHNVNTMGATCLKVGEDDGHGDRCLAIADEILVSRGVAVEAGKLLNRGE